MCLAHRHLENSLFELPTLRFVLIERCVVDSAVLQCCGSAGTSMHRQRLAQAILHKLTGVLEAACPVN